MSYASPPPFDPASASLGHGQVWTDQGASYNPNTVYQNTKGRPIQISFRANSSGASIRTFEVSPDNLNWVLVGWTNNNNGGGGNNSPVIPDGWFFRINGNCTIDNWAELS